MIGVPYWDHRLSRWGAWLATGGGRISQSPIASMRSLGTRVQAAGQNEVPMVHEAERDTEAMVAALPGLAPSLLRVYYMRRATINELAFAWESHPDTVRRWIRDSHKRLQRQLERRRRGERPAPVKALTVRAEQANGRQRAIASVVPD